LSGGGTIAATDSILTAFGKVQNQISALVGGATYQGTWNASTNTPTLASGTGTKGYYYVVSVAGSTNLDGITDWKVGDWAIFNGTTWDKVDNTDAVSSVNGFTGAVNLALDNISDVSAASPTNAQLLRFNGTSSLWENWTPTFEPALTKGNLTEATSSVLTITGGTGAVIGSGTTIAVAQASGSTSGYLSSTDWTTFNNKQAALTNPVTGTGTNNYIPKFTATGSTIGDSSLYYSQGANSNSYTFGSVGAGAIYNLSQFNIYSNSTSEMFFQWGSNKYLYIGNSSGNVSFSSINTGTHNYNNIIYYNGASASDRYISFGTEAVDRLTIEQNGDIQLNKYTSNGFVKTSGGNGTLSVDTTSYLPLTGGTLTGALSGTSATFSSALSELNVISTGASNIGSITIQGGEGANAQLTLQADDADNASDITILRQADGGTFSIITNNGGVNALQIAATTGAATFSSSVSATSATFSDTISATKNRSNTAGTVGLKIAPADTVVSFGFRVDSATNSLNLDNSYDNTNLFKISSTGAATFSSSVTATSGTFSSLTSGYVTKAGASGLLSNSFIYDGGGYGGMNNTGLGSRTFVINAANGRPLALELIEYANVHAVYIRPNVSSVNLISSNYISGGVYLPLSLSAREVVSDFVISTSGNVGIGTTSPSEQLNLQGANAYTSKIRFTYGASATGYYANFGYNSDGNKVYLQIADGAAASNIMTWNYTGNVGIGTTSPNTKLEVYSSTAGTATIGRFGAANYGIAANKTYIQIGTQYEDGSSRIGSSNPSGNLSELFFETATATSGVFAERMRITSAGITQLKPASNELALEVFVGATSTGAMIGDANNFIIGGQTGKGLVLCTNNLGQEKMRITTGGNVGIGTTSPASNRKLTVAGGAQFTYGDNSGASFNIVPGANGQDGADFNLSYYTGIGYGPLTFTVGGSERMRITSGGELLINTTTDSGAYYLQVNGSVYATAYYESSDIRLKDVLTNSYSENFSAIEFMWKDNRDDRKHWGYAAQDVMKYIPDAIEVNKDGMMTVNYNEAHTWKISHLEKEILELKAKIK